MRGGVRRKKEREGERESKKKGIVTVGFPSLFIYLLHHYLALFLSVYFASLFIPFVFFL